MTAKALKIGEEISDNRAIEYALNDIGLFYQETGDYDKALEYYFSKQSFDSVNNE